MPSAVLCIQWDSYAGAPDTPALFAIDPLSYNSRQSRLHDLAAGDKLWLVARAPDDRQYYFVAVLTIAAHRRNDNPSPLAPLSGRGVGGEGLDDNHASVAFDPSHFGPYALIADPAASHDLARNFPAEGLLRALTFDTANPIQHGANLGQSLQTLRLLAVDDERLLDSSLQRLLTGESPLLDTPFGLWTKCDHFFADYFLKNWIARRRPQAFLLYDSPPILPHGSPVFIHADQYLRLTARFLESQYIAGHRFTCDEPERLAERDHV